MPHRTLTRTLALTLTLTLAPTLTLALILTLAPTLTRYELCHIGGATFDTTMMVSGAESTQLPSYHPALGTTMVRWQCPPLAPLGAAEGAPLYLRPAHA
eukprot:scaffold131920_cov72-Phaeocystis_antarctica.AAC.3